jgi:hypothetical protein
MGWAETRAAARQDIHDTFAFNGRYYSALGVGNGSPVSVRVHSKVVPQGGLGAEGYAQSDDDTECVVFMAADVARLGIKQGGVVVLKNPPMTLKLKVRPEGVDPLTVEYETVRV